MSFAVEQRTPIFEHKSYEYKSKISN